MGYGNDRHLLTGRRRLEYTRALLVSLRNLALRDDDHFVVYTLDMTILHLTEVLRTLCVEVGRETEESA